MTNQDSAIGILRSSAIVRFVERLIDAVERTARQSTSHAIGSELAAAWRRADRAVRLRSVGTALVTAVLIHAALMALQPLPGWRAFVVPAIALAQGLLLIVSSPSPRSTR